MIDLVRRALALLDPGTRFRIAIGVAPSVVLGLLEVVGIGLILPLVQVLSNEDAVTEGGIAEALYDALGGGSVSRFTVVLGLLIVGVLLARLGLGLAFSRWQVGVVMKAEADMAARLDARFLGAPYAFHLQHNSAELIQLVRFHTENFFGLVVQPIILSVTDLAVAAIVLLALVMIEPIPAVLAGVFFGVLSAVFFAIVSKWSVRAGQESATWSDELQLLLQHSLQGWKSIRVLERTDYFARQYSVGRHKWAETRRDQVFISQLPRIYLESALVVVILVVAFVILGTASSSAHGLGALALFVAVGLRLMPQLNRLLSSYASIKSGSAMMAVVEAQLRTDVGHDQPDAASPAEIQFDDVIELKNVSFTYSGECRPALDGVDLKIRKGSSIGIVGPSGAGKTTLVDVLLGLHEIDGGRILVDDVEVPFHSTRAWHRLVGYVPQDIFLLDDTLERNIALGLDDADIDSQRVKEALELAQLSDMVGRLDRGVKTRLGERGVRLSGGQRQRVAIARALYGRPKVLMLDEATSALDTETEAVIAETIRDLSGQLTIVLVAHRLSTVKHCDEIYFLVDGAIADRGSFQDLVRSNARFAALARSGSVDRGEE